jgi:hypothetical protein
LNTLLKARASSPEHKRPASTYLVHVMASSPNDVANWRIWVDVTQLRNTKHRQHVQQ